MQTSVKNIFTTLLEEHEGYSFGDPKRVDEKSLAVVMPILRLTEHARRYVTLPESEKARVFDTGKIDEMEVENQEDCAVFIRTGSLFRGATQERTAQRSFVVFPARKTKVAVRCVHMSKGIASGAGVKSSDFVPHDVLNKCYTHGYAPKNQHDYWSSVGHTTGCMMRMSSSKSFGDGAVCSSGEGSGIAKLRQDAVDEILLGAGQSVFGGIPIGADNLAKHFDKFAKDFESVLSKIRRHDNQAGMALITDGGVQLVEVFDHPASWTALHTAAVKSMGTKVVTEDAESVFEFKPAHAKAMVRKVLAQPWEHKDIYYHEASAKKNECEVRITGLTAKDYVGECVEIDNQVAHLMVFKRED